MDAVMIAVKPGLLLVVGQKEYTVEFPLPAVIEAEEKLGRSLRNPTEWFCAAGKDIPVLLEAGLRRHHPDVTSADIAEICDPLGPEGCGEIAEALGTLAFPRWTARYKENLEKLKAKGAESPNGVSADAR